MFTQPALKLGCAGTSVVQLDQFTGKAIEARFLVRSFAASSRVSPQPRDFGVGIKRLLLGGVGHV